MSNTMTIERIDNNGKMILEPLEVETLAALIKGEVGKESDDASKNDEEEAKRGTHFSKQEVEMFRTAIEALREKLPEARGIGMGTNHLTKDVPRVYPMALLAYEKKQLVLLQGSGLVLLDIQDVYTDDERQQVLAAVRTLPMTLMAFTGSSGMSMKVLVRVRPASGKEGKTLQLKEIYYRAAHKQMRALYSALVPQRISVAYELKLNDGFLLSYDPQLYYNPDAVAAVVDKTMKVKMLRPSKKDAIERDLHRPVPADAHHRDYYDRLFDALMDEVREEFIRQGREADLEGTAYLRTVVERAAERNVEEAEVRARMMRLFEWEIDDDIRRFVREVYESKYPMAHTGNKARDVVRGMVQVLTGNYEFRQNVLSHALYFRERTTYGEWRRVEAADVNTMALEVQEAGVAANTHHVQTYLNSRRIPQVNPLELLISRVRGKWDGRDRIEALARRVPTSMRQWPKYFHIWFLAMVRQWLTASPDHGNEVVPLLIGPQGVGKSTFCRRLLPPELIDGYIDHLDFSQEKEVLRAMATFQLINIDEFNRYSAKDQTGKLKNYLQMTDIRLKTPYRTSFDILQRTASFIGTSNPSEILADTTGSRRFICVEVTGVIDQLTPIDYQQLYAQAIAELDARAALGSRATSRDVGRTYFTKQEEATIQRSNQRFMQPSLAVERFQLLFEPIATRKRARSGEATEELTLEEVFEALQQGLHTPLSNGERNRLKAHLQKLYKDGKIAYYRISKGYCYHLKRRKNV